MPVPIEETCEVCGNTYWQGDCRFDFNNICDGCRGISHESPPEITNREEWLAAISKHQDGAKDA
jgi:hypothetical protein